MPHSMRYPVEPFVPRTNGSGTPAPQQGYDSMTPSPQRLEQKSTLNGSVASVPQQQKEMSTRSDSATPTPQLSEQMSPQNGLRNAATQPSVIMPLSNGSGRSFPSLDQTNGSGIPASNGSRTPTPKQQQEIQNQKNGSRAPFPRPCDPQPQQIPAHDGNDFSSVNTFQEPSLLMNIGSQTYIRFDEASRFFTHRNDDVVSHPPQSNGHHGRWVPHISGHNGSFPHHSNGHGDYGFMTEPLVFRPQTAPPPIAPLEILPARGRADTIRSLEYAFQPDLPPYCQPGNYQYYPDHQYPVHNPYYYPVVQPQHPVHDLTSKPAPVPWVPPVYLRKTARFKSDDPEAKLFVGDLPITMTKEALVDALKWTFSAFGECKVNVDCKPKYGPNGALKMLPTGWIQYKNMFEASKALDFAKERDFTIGKRSVRIDRADGKRICRMWPTNPHAKPSLDDFKDAIRQYVDHVGSQSGNCVLYHVSNRIEMVKKHYHDGMCDVPSVGIVFRWVEDASYSVQKFPEFTYQFKLKIEHVNSGTPAWRKGPESLRFLDALLLDTGEKWQEELILSRRRLRDRGEEFPDGTMARYPERISKKVIPRSILEHPRLKKDVFGFDPYYLLDWLDLDRESPTSLARHQFQENGSGKWTDQRVLQWK